jgi:hypothetical protein
LDSGEKGYDEKEKRQRKKIERKNESDWPVLQKSRFRPTHRREKKEEPEDIKKREHAASPCLADIKLLLYFVAGR